MPDDPVSFCTEPFDRALRGEVEVVGSQSDHFAAKRVERVCEKKELARSVHVRALPALGVKRVANLDALDLGDDVVISSAADDRTGAQFAHGPGQHVPGSLAGQSGGDVCGDLRLFGNPGVPQLPQAAVGDGSLEIRHMVHRERLQTHAVTLERNRSDFDHESCS